MAKLIYDNETGTYHDPVTGKEVNPDDPNAPDSGRPLDGDTASAVAPQVAPIGVKTPIVPPIVLPTVPGGGSTTGTSIADITAKSGSASATANSGNAEATGIELSPEAKKAKEELQAAVDTAGEAEKGKNLTSAEHASVLADIESMTKGQLSESNKKAIADNQAKIDKEEKSFNDLETERKADKLELFRRQDNPKSYWDHTSKGNQVLSLLGVALGGISRNPEHKNAVFDAVISDINRFHEEQQKALLSRENLLKDITNTKGKSLEAIRDYRGSLATILTNQNTASVQDMEALKSRANAEAAKIGSPQALAAVKDFNAKVDQKIAEKKLENERIEQKNVKATGPSITETVTAPTTESKLEGKSATNSVGFGNPKIPSSSPAVTTAAIPTLPPNATPEQKAAVLKAIQDHKNNPKTKKGDVNKPTEPTGAAVYLNGKRIAGIDSEPFLGKVSDPNELKKAEEFARNEPKVTKGTAAIKAFDQMLKIRADLPKTDVIKRQQIDKYLQGTLAPQMEAAFLSLGGSNSFSEARVGPLYDIFQEKDPSKKEKLWNAFFTDVIGTKDAGLKGFAQGLSEALENQAPAVVRNIPEGEHKGKRLVDAIDTETATEANRIVAKAKKDLDINTKDKKTNAVDQAKIDRAKAIVSGGNFTEQQKAGAKRFLDANGVK